MASVNDSGNDDSTGEVSAPSRTKRVATYGLVGVSVVAVAVVIVGLLLPQDPPELTTAPPPASDLAQSTPAEPPRYDVVEEPFDATAAIPGCTTVQAPSKSSYSTSSLVGEQSYDNPKFPWFNGPKATAMSNALKSLLPRDVEIDFASPDQSLIFQPIDDFGDTDPEPRGSTIAYGSLTNGDAKGGVQVSVQKTSDPVPPCVAGELDERRTMSDGTVIDVHDTWREVNGVRTNTRSADAYVPDGSRIYASADDSLGGTGQEHSGQIPLTVDELARVVDDPRLRVSTSVPPGTLAPSDGCSESSARFAADGPPVTREQARMLDAVLASVSLGGRRLAPLQLQNFGKGALCTSMSNAETSDVLHISIVGGQKLPVEQRPDPVSGGQSTFRRLDDGTVVQTQGSGSVTVTHPGGTQITVGLNDGPPSAEFPLNRLESIALTPGLEL